MREAAYLLAMIDTRATPPALRGIALFSEESPTTLGGNVYATVMKGYGETYSEGCHDIVKRLRAYRYDWALKLLAADTRNAWVLGG